MAGEPFRLLIVSAGDRQSLLPHALTAGRFTVDSAAPAEVEARLREADFDAVIVFADCHSKELVGSVKHWKGIRPRTQLVVFLEQTLPARALVGLMHAGCQEVFDASEAADVGAVLNSLHERIKFVRVHQLERLRAKQSVPYTGLVGESPEMVKVYDHMLRAARINCPVLVLGETGTGKGLVAHAIHALSERSERPFVTVDCGCLAPTLIESELYGVARGAFTGATADRAGLVEAAQQGTLFLDEIGNLPLSMQPKLLRLLEEGEVRRVGSARATPVDVRVVAATGRELESLIAGDQFRLDLYYRLNVLHIELPPLRQRPQDIPLLARHFASRHFVHGEPVSLSGAAIDRLLEYSWPGNVRELKNAIEAAVSALSGPLIHIDSLPGRFGPNATTEAQPEFLKLREVERLAILRALEVAANDKARAARLLGIGKTTLYRKLKQMRPDEHRTGKRTEPRYLM